MKSFWWFKKNAVAGMARPGLNHVHFFDLTFDEAVVLGWLGTYSSGQASFNCFEDHLQSYVPKVFRFHGLDQESGLRALEAFKRREKVLEVMDQLNERASLFGDFQIHQDALHFEFCQNVWPWRLNI